MFNKLIKKKNTLTLKEKDNIAKLLGTNPAALEEFEKAYRKEMLNEPVSDNLFEVNTKQASSMQEHITADEAELEEIMQRIVAELLQETSYFSYKDGKTYSGNYEVEAPGIMVTKEEILSLDKDLRPQLTGSMMCREIQDEAYPLILSVYADYVKEKNPKKKQFLYGMFRQGLEIHDLDEIMYRMLDRNPNSMGNWFPQLAEAITEHPFFKLPDTTIIKVPITMLQLARLDYFNLTKPTLEIVDRFCEKAFQLDRDKEYFIKTGVFSSKYDFRNAHVKGAKEVRTLGEYLLYIQFQSGCFAHYDLSRRNQPVMYGPASTAEWVVREFVKDKDEAPTIYKGLPLHTEYRVFIDADTDKILGIAPYWRSDVMKKRFGHEEDKDSPHQIHDYITYSAYESKLMNRYETNREQVIKEVEKILPNLDLAGQWSLDIMQNGNDFYIIDMALAINSALSDCVPKELLHEVKETWLPELD